jgi:hypothetical protein
VTHGLTMRLILMHLAGWSPNTFHSIWNADNCSMYVLQRDLTLVGGTPYALSADSDTIRSSLMVHVKFAEGMAETVRQLVEQFGQCEPPRAKPSDEEDSSSPACFLELDRFLDLPPPRTRQGELAKRMLAQQYGVAAETIQEVDFLAGRSGYSRDVARPQKYR